MPTNRCRLRAGQTHCAAERVTGGAREDRRPYRLLNDKVDGRDREDRVDAGPVRVRAASLRSADRCRCGQGRGDRDCQVPVLDRRGWEDDRRGHWSYQYLVLTGRGVAALV